VSIPSGWSIVDAGGGAYDGTLGRVVWALDPIVAGVSLGRQMTVRAPTTSPIDGGLDFVATFASRLEVSGSVAIGPSVTVFVAPLVEVEHSMVGRVDDLTLLPAYAPSDSALRDVQRFDMVRVRFQVRNEGDRPVTFLPQLEYRPAPGGAFVTVPGRGSVAGVAFYVSPEWVSSGMPDGGTVLGPESEVIGVDAMRSRDKSDPAQVSAVGLHSMSSNPATPLILPAMSYTEVEFSIRPTTDAQYQVAYEFRISNDGAPLVGAVAATLQMGGQPPLLESPVQNPGVRVGPAANPGFPFTHRLAQPGSVQSDPSALQPAGRTPSIPGGLAASTSPALKYPLVLPGSVPSSPPSSAASPSSSMQYALITDTLAGSPLSAAFGGSTVDIHGPYGMAADQCAFCHSSHAAQGSSALTVSALPQSTLCFQCHDSAGTGATSKVQAQFVDPSVPANSPSTGSYYRHDALASGSGHTLATENEFGGVSNRHSECSDCHNPHDAAAAASVETPNGWTAPGQLTGISGIAVANGGANSAPNYAFLDGATGKVTLEYQLCLKCHSGSTVLLSKDPLHPSWWAEDKGIEFNPANGSFHPIEAPGKNATTAMANSLAGTSPYKLWTFTTDSTIRCVNCHGDSRKFDTTSPPAAGSDLSPHADQYRGILIQNYRDRSLKLFTEPYQSSDFALCYVCHAEAPFSDASGSPRTDTNYRYHGFHLTSIRNFGNINGDIDTAGAGRGDAICSECHFRSHSTAFAGDFRTSPQSGTDAGLVNFAPDVTPYNGVIEWIRTGPSSGTCTLTCHGKGHEDASY
jgi:predicted CXXCH cytochrome family protein